MCPRNPILDHLVVDPMKVLILRVHVILLRARWISRLSKEIANPGWAALLNSYSSLFAFPISAWHSDEQETWAACFETMLLDFSWALFNAFISSTSCCSPRLSSFLRMLGFELVSLILLNLERVVYFEIKLYIAIIIKLRFSIIKLRYYDLIFPVRPIPLFSCAEPNDNELRICLCWFALPVRRMRRAAFGTGL